MKAFESYRLLITPLSPVHIGTGESFEPTNYVIEDGALHAFDTGAAVQAMSAKDRAELLKVASCRPGAEMLTKIQGFFYQRRESLIAFANQRIPVLPGVAKLYAQRVSQAANREADGGKVVNKLEIDRTGSNPVTRLPMLFGSSLKGAIRTALLDQRNGGKRLQKDPQSGNEEKSLQLQQRLFQYRAGKFELDPMRLVQLADAPWVASDGLPASQIQLAVNRKKAPVTDSSGVLRKSKADSLYQTLECLPGWRYRALAGQLSIQSLAALDADGRHDAKLPKRELRFSARNIAQACNAFYTPILKAEIDLMTERGYHDESWVKSIWQLLKASEAAMQRGDVFLLRVGRHSGAESVTLNGARDGHIKIMLGKDPATGKPQSSCESEPRTLWLAARDQDQTNGLLPFGWLLIELHVVTAPAPDWSNLREACEPYLADARAFSERLRANQAAIEAQRRIAEENKRAELEAARQREENEADAARAKIEHETKRASMSAALLAVQDFIDYMQKRHESLRGKREGPNREEHNKARQLSKTAMESAEWSSDEKKAAAEAIAEWLPKVVAVDMKDERKKLKLAALRGEA